MTARAGDAVSRVGADLCRRPPADHDLQGGQALAGPRSDPHTQRGLEAFRQDLRDLGWAEGHNISVEPRWTEGRPERIPEVTADLVRLRGDVSVALGHRVVEDAKQGSGTIPAGRSVSSDPMGLGRIKTLARSGGNISGPSSQNPDPSGKRLELLKGAI